MVLSNCMMTFSKVLCPLLRTRHILFDAKPYLLYCRAIKYKSMQSPTAMPGSRPNVETTAQPLKVKVKETTKTASYLGVIVLGIAVTGSLFYAVFNELFSSKSPNNVYSKAMKYCINDPRVQDKLGTPIKAFGEETRRGRRQHVNHLLYEKDGVKHLRMKFYLQGTRNKATVQLDMVENESGNYEYRFLFVDIHGYSKSTIVLEDNRAQQNTSA